MRILITGGSGYIGSALAIHLREVGHAVKTLDLVPPADIVLDYRELSAAGYGIFDAIVHLAGHSSVAQCAAEPLQATQNNLTSFIKVLRKLNFTVPLLWASSASVLSPVAGNLYDATKRAAEAMIPALYPNSYALRFGTVCGVSPNMRWDLMLNKMASSAYTDGLIRVSNPAVSRPILAIRDLCSAVAALLQTDAPGTYNLVSGSDTIENLASAAAKHFGAEMRLEPNSPTYDFKMQGTPIAGYRAECSVVSILADLETHMSNRA